LIVGPGTANEDADVVFDELRLVLAECCTDSLESRSHVGEIGDATSDDQNLFSKSKNESSFSEYTR
jgi:hypothetical protein